MNLFKKIAASALLLLNGSAAIYGGLSLVLYPDGSKIGLPADLLQHSVFDNFLIPGLALLVFIGLFNLLTLIAVIVEFRNSRMFVVLQGVILTIWLIAQMIMIHFMSSMHLVMLIVALLLILTGYALHTDNDKKEVTQIERRRA